MLYTRTYIHREPKVSERARSSRCRRKGAEATEAYLDQITKTRQKIALKNREIDRSNLCLQYSTNFEYKAMTRTENQANLLKIAWKKFVKSH